MKLWKNYEPLKAMSFPMYHVPGKFAPPQGTFRSEYIHVEYQKLNCRQPFYHRNTDVDEISYHVAGKRTLLSELGSVPLAVGDFARIPVGVAHDNRGIDDVHIIFYIPQGVEENISPYRSTEYKLPPFEGWEPMDTVEFITGHLSEVGSDTSVFYTDEKMLLDTAQTEEVKIAVLKASGSDSLEWLYKSADVWLGSTSFASNDGTVYTRHRCADELQIQIKGKRTLVSQRGMLDIEPGDFVSIPLGCAFTSIAHEENTYVTALMRYPAQPMKDFSKVAKATSVEQLALARRPLQSLKT